MTINNILLVLLFVGLILKCSGTSCAPKYKGPSDNSMFDIHEEGKNQNSRPNIFIDADRLTGNAVQEDNTSHKQHIGFSYDNGAPNSWYKEFPKCAGSRQSPIDIQLPHLKDVAKDKLTWNKVYNEMPALMSITNNGHSVALTLEYSNPKDRPQIHGGPLGHTYTLDHVHFHWSTSNYQGCEHTINGKSFPLEMHAVHYKSDMTMANAASAPKGLAVIGYVFSIADSCTEAIDDIIAHVGKLKQAQDTPVRLTNMFKISDLVEIFTSDYVSYEGSLTTPPCYESVTWIVCPYEIPVLEIQLKAFRSLYDSSPGLKNNFRPVQPLNGRNVSFITSY